MLKLFKSSRILELTSDKTVYLSMLNDKHRDYNMLSEGYFLACVPFRKLWEKIN